MSIPDPFDPRSVRAAYDTAAADYVAAFADDLDHLPVDRAVLDHLAGSVRPDAPVLDLGCGPGQVAQYLDGHGLSTLGLDLAPQMLVRAARRTVGPRYACGDLRALPFRSGSLAGVAAFYSVQHVRRAQLLGVLREIHRVLGPDGVLVVATHLGEGQVTLDEFLGHRVEPFAGTFYGRRELEELVEGRAFRLEDVRLRDPLPHEHPSKRIYLTARRLED